MAQPSNLPPALRRQVREAARQQTAVQNGVDPFQNKPPAPAASPPVAPAAGPTLQPVPQFAVVGDEIPEGFVPVDLTRGDPRAQPQPAPAAAPQPPTNPSSRWVPASQGNQPAPAASPQPAARQPAPAQVPANMPPPGAQPAANDGDQRYRVLQGKYNSETRELRGTVQQLVEQNRQLMSLVATQRAAPAAPPAAPKTVRERALAVGFTEKEIEEFGEELVAMMLRTAENVAGPQLAQLRQENARLASTVQNTVQSVSKNAVDRFWDDLSALVPEWAEINASQEWLDWLQVREVFSGRTRNDGLQNAFAEHDAHRVAGILKAFKAEDARAPAAGAQTHLDPATLVAPGQSGGGTPAPAGMNGDADRRIWDEEEVNQFYSAKRRGRVKGDEAVRIEAEINRALVEGRIRPTRNDANLINSR